MTKTKRNLPILLMTLLLSVSSIRMCVDFVFEREGLNVLIKYVLIVLTLLFVIGYFRRLFKPIIVVVLISTIVLFNYLLFPENRIYIYQMMGETWPYLIAIFLCGSVIEASSLERAFLYSAIVTLLFELVLISSEGYFKMLTEVEYGGIGAVFSSMMLLPAVVFAFKYRWGQYNIYLLLSVICGILMVVLGGKRMTMICYIFTLLYIFVVGRTRIQKIKFLFTSITILFLFIIFFPEVCAIVSDLFSINLGENRIFEKFTSVDIVSSKGRDEIHDELYNNIFTLQGLFIGYGINGDMVLTKTHEYSHNFFLELIVEFGIIMGALITTLFFFLIYKTYHYANEYKQLLIMLLFLALLPLLQSGSFWSFQMFWLFMGISMHVVLRNMSSIKDNIVKN